MVRFYPIFKHIVTTLISGSNCCVTFLNDYFYKVNPWISLGEKHGRVTKGCELRKRWLWIPLVLMHLKYETRIVSVGYVLLEGSEQFVDLTGGQLFTNPYTHQLQLLPHFSIVLVLANFDSCDILGINGILEYQTTLQVLTNIEKCRIVSASIPNEINISQLFSDVSRTLTGFRNLFILSPKISEAEIASHYDTSSLSNTVTDVFPGNICFKTCGMEDIQLAARRAGELFIILRYCIITLTIFAIICMILLSMAFGWYLLKTALICDGRFGLPTKTIFGGISILLRRVTPSSSVGQHVDNFIAGTSRFQESKYALCHDLLTFCVVVELRASVISECDKIDMVRWGRIQCSSVWCDHSFPNYHFH
ncbi:hypothetical protein DINM_006469 [Dirofilaria immitis]|nr:hypothetical protein [Dirofilaria immitis]